MNKITDVKDDGVDHITPFDDMPGSGPIVLVVIGVVGLAAVGFYATMSKLVEVMF